MVKQIPKQNRPGPKKNADGCWILDDDDDGGVSVRPPVQLNHALHLLPANPVPSQQTKYLQQTEELTSFRPLKFCKRAIKSGVLCDLCFDGTFFFSRISQVTEQNVVFLFQQSRALPARDLEMIK